MKMVKIKKCDVSECAYNSGNMCHTLAITVGHDPAHPMCDTFCRAETKGGQMNITAGIGACKVSACAFNNALECQAPSVEVGHRQNEVDCLTFKQR